MACDIADSTFTCISHEAENCHRPSFLYSSRLHTNLMSSLLPAPNNKTILITGVNGYIASNLAYYFLTSGYFIRGAVRSSTKKAFVLNSSAFKPFASRIQIFIVPHITVEDAFKEAVKGIFAIFHLATPINFWSGTAKEVVNPAVNGTLGILNAAHKHAGPELQVFVYMSSLVTVLDPSNSPPHHYTSESWNTSAENAISSLANDERAPFGVLYSASKILAEKTVFNFSEDMKPRFRIVSLIPGVVIGPPVLFPEKVQDINGTIKPIWEVLSGENRGLPRIIGTGFWVDVRDLVGICCALIESSKKPEIDRKRVIVVAGKGNLSVAARVLWEKYSERLGHLQVSERDGDVEVGGEMTFDVKDAEGLLGRTWMSYEKSVLDTAEALENYVDLT